jgi:hypothetical protein
LRRPFLPAIGALAGGYCIVALLLAAIDPLALYPWGIPGHLRADGDYSMELTPYLIDAVAKDPNFDTLFLGGSTGHFYTPQMMEEILPHTRRAFNLSYARPSAQDRAVVAREVLRHSHARHFLLEADWPYAVPARDQHIAESFPLYLYDNNWWNDVRQINWQMLKLTLAVLRNNSLWTSSWGKTQEQVTFETQFEAIHSPVFEAKYAAVIARRKAGVDAPSNLTCEAMDTIGTHLVPFVRALSQRGAQVDLLFPPYSWLIYYRAGESGDPLNRPSFLNDVLLLRKCIVQAVDGLAGVRVFAFDDVPAIGGDFRKYMDAGHLYDPDTNRYILQSIANGEHRLTGENIAAKNAEMEANVDGFQLTGSNFGSPAP